MFTIIYICFKALQKITIKLIKKFEKMKKRKIKVFYFLKIK